LSWREPPTFAPVVAEIIDDDRPAYPAKRTFGETAPAVGAWEEDQAEALGERRPADVVILCHFNPGQHANRLMLEHVTVKQPFTGVVGNEDDVDSVTGLDQFG
jgi:hypothetical protein